MRALIVMYLSTLVEIKCPTLKFTFLCHKTTVISIRLDNVANHSLIEVKRKGLGSVGLKKNERCEISRICSHSLICAKD